jgi:hypothetical protein
MRMLHNMVVVVLVPAVIVWLHLPDCFSRTWDVPLEIPGIPEAVDSALYGDTVSVAAGTYVCPDNVDYSFEWIDLPSGVSLIGAGAELTVVIDSCITLEPHSVVAMYDASDCLVKGFSFVRSARVAGHFYGILVENTSDTFIDSCRFDHFFCGISVEGETTHPDTPNIRWSVFTNCGMGIECAVQPFGCPVIRFNAFGSCSWGIYCVNSGPYVADNHIANSFHSGVYCIGRSPAWLDRNVIVNNGEYGLRVETEVFYEPYLTTEWLPQNGNSIYGNAICDLYNGVEDQRGIVEARCTYWGSDCPDTLKVIQGPGRVNYRPWCDSLHTETYIECPPDLTSPSTWSSIKAMFR